MSPAFSDAGRAREGHKYEPVSASEHEAQELRLRRSIEDPATLDLEHDLKGVRQKNRKRLAYKAMTVIGILLLSYWAIA